VTREPRLEDLWRQCAPQVLSRLVARWGQFDACEDAVQEALVAAAWQWPESGVPDNPYGWLLTVATRRVTDEVRRDSARRRREGAVAAGSVDQDVVLGGGEAQIEAPDDTLTLLLLCCHPTLTAPSQIALTLRAVGGLTTTEIARAFLVPDATMAQRISRAKQRIREAGATFGPLPPAERDERLRSVLQVLYLIFNEGYLTTAGSELGRRDLTGEAIRLSRVVHALLPDDGEATGLLALMLLTEARHAARTGAGGSIVALADQDRSRWDRDLIAEGVALITDALSRTRLGPYQLQAAVAAVHDEAASVADTDWAEIVALYRLLESISPNPMVTLNRAVAVAMVEGPRAGIDLVDRLETDDRMARHHRLHAVRAHLLELDGEPAAARRSYVTAARYATNLPERRYLEARAARLGVVDPEP
jgi:predicted RNA polymerase sigma factor